MAKGRASHQNQKLERWSRQEQLLQHFSPESGYAEKQVGSEWYIKMWNGNAKRWQVAVYSEESFKRYKGLASELDEKFRSQFPIL
jgi:hypothetical protein